MNGFPAMPEGTDSATREAWRVQIARLPFTMQPALRQQVSDWEDLFPFEQKRTARFLNTLSFLPTIDLDVVAHSLREIEMKMGVARWNFSITRDTMSNAAQLARSPYYSEWRREVQRVFSAIESRAPDPIQPERSAGRLMVLVLPDTLPVRSVAGHKPWDQRGIEYRVDGDVHRVSELALRNNSGLPSVLAAKSFSSPDVIASNCWLIDAEAHLGPLLSSNEDLHASLLQYSILKPFKDQFLQQVNTVPKDIEGTDQILARMRHQDWGQWWPISMAGRNRLRSFMVELFLSGNGALIFPNSFVQWAVSEAIRRARPRLIVARFGMRNKPKPFTSIAIFENQQRISAVDDVEDPEGSATDALVLARYCWLSALRYPEAEQTSCICVCESTRSVYIIASEAKRPPWPGGTAVTPEQLHAWMSSCLG